MYVEAFRGHERAMLHGKRDSMGGQRKGKATLFSTRRNPHVLQMQWIEVNNRHEEAQRICS
jgi:hypothetical protein